MIYFDTETCGFHGPIILIQYAVDDGPVHLHNVWMSPIQDTLALIEEMANSDVVAFNLAFDWFHIYQTYTTLRQFSDWSVHPIDHIEEYTKHEATGRDCPDCLKPKACCDLMLHARRGPYQSLMDRKDVRIRRVPAAVAELLAAKLTELIPLDDVYFSRKSDPTERWKTYEVKDDVDQIIPELRDVVLKFAPSSALKALAKAAGVAKEKRLMLSAAGVAKQHMPKESGYAPYAEAMGVNGWPKVIMRHIEHWEYNPLAREYAEDDVLDTRNLYHHFGDPKIGDVDSDLAAMIGVVRWRGFKVDLERIKALKRRAHAVINDVPFNFQSHDLCRRWLSQELNDVEKAVMSVSGKLTTKAVVLEEIAKWKDAQVCKSCDGLGCELCEEGLIQSGDLHPAAVRARMLLAARHAKKEIELYDKILLAKRFHVSLDVIGTLSGRMSGRDGLNAQGIRRTEEVRSCFGLADPPLVLCGGDFESFEMVIMDAVYGDPLLRKDLMSGKKIHALFGELFFPNMSYDEIIASKGAPGEQDKYERSKRGVFGLAYGGNAFTLSNRVGISEEAAEEGYNRITSKYKVWGQERRKYFDMFCSMRQEGGIGTEVTWAEPADYVESMLGFRRYFTLENKICKALFNLARSIPPEWKKISGSVIRRDRQQTIGGAVSTALYAAAFAQQAANMRAAANHVIQSTGAELTKQLQHEVWSLQPSGVHKWCVQPFNVHDEIMVPTLPELFDTLTETVNNFVTKHKQKVPLMAIDWGVNLDSWAAK